jgi:CRP-like cAMP-binding protein
MLSPRTNLSKLSNPELVARTRSLSWLSPAQLKRLTEAMTVIEVPRRGVILREAGRPSSDVHILLLGTAQMSHRDGRAARTIAILSPGVIFKPPPLPAEVGYDFEWTALTHCRVARLPFDRFINITLGIGAAEFARVIESRNARLGGLLARYPGFLHYNLAQRVTLALLELARDFGVRDARGMLLRISPTHHQLADLVGASRSKVTEALGDLEQRDVIVRQGRRLILNPAKAGALLRSAA